MNSRSHKVVTRFPPSPTGNFHVGGCRTALFNYLYAKHCGGLVRLRIEDTDKERSSKESEQDIIGGLAWLGIVFDPAPDGEPFWRQSERTDIYKKALERMIAEGKAYFSKEEPKKEGQRGEVLRFKNPGHDVAFQDIIRGEIKINVAELGDFVIAKSIEEPLYHLAVVIDDAEMGVTHVIRGEDGVYNTPRQILLIEALGYEQPSYAHVPFILDANKKKLSKRFAATSLQQYKEEGYLPSALINYLATLGWSPHGGGGEGEKEIFSIEELVERFDLSKIQKSGAVWNPEKLRWMNREYIRKLPIELSIKYAAECFERAGENVKKETLARALPILIERISVWSDLSRLIENGGLKYLVTAPAPTREQLGDLEYLSRVIELLEPIVEEVWTMENIKTAVWDFASEVGRGKVLAPMRIALSGLPQSPDPFSIAYALGKKETEKRLRHAVSLC